MNIEQIDSLSLRDAMAAGRVVLVDVREPDEYKDAYIDGAVLIPLKHCQPQTLPRNPDKMLVFSCKAGGRSQNICNVVAVSFPDVTIYNHAGGIMDWIANGLPVSSVEE